jgi:uncharacterized pyridoxal phosphate-containing UPF0001 family protein
MIAENLKRLWDRINTQCAASGINSEEIKLIAVSKYFGLDAITETNNHGITNIGENKAQELRD